MESPPGARIVVEGRSYDYFGGTGYLGLQGHPEVITAAQDAVARYGLHTATSRTRLESPIVRAVELEAARFFACEEAFHFVSGYLAPAVGVQALRGRIDAVFIDAASHYALFEAARQSGLPVQSFATRDPDDLARSLAEHLPAGGRPLVLSDGVFASCGSIAPVDRFCSVLRAFPGAVLLLDDAHAFGVLGEHGRGTLEHFGLWPDANRLDDDGTAPTPRLIAVGTLSKALGGFGGILPGTRDFVAAARQASDYHAGASAPPVPAAAATACALAIAGRHPELRDALRQNTTRLRAGLRALGIDSPDLPTPILGFTLATATDMQRLHARLRARDILLPYAAAYPGIGPEGAMRLAVFATHEAAALDRLLDELGTALTALGR